MRGFLVFVLVGILSSGVSAETNPVTEKLKPDQQKVWNRMQLDWTKCTASSVYKGKEIYFNAERSLQACTTEEQVILEFLREQAVPVSLFLEIKLGMKRWLVEEALK
jgi:hypothetical protein